MEDLLRLTSQAAKQNMDWAGIERALSSFVIPMSRTLQNPAFHGEGDVWTHTKMVCQELVNLPAFRVLDDYRQQMVFLAALLHDIGKIPATRWEDGCWVSPNHALAGAAMARQYLWQALGLCGTPEKLRFRETVCSLIRWHSFPPHAIDDPEGKRKLMAIAADGELLPDVSLELLCLLSQADALGRECGDKGEMLDRIALCAELAKEGGCLSAPFPFPSEHTRHAFLSGRRVSPDLELFDDTWGQVILLSGLPGTGKDTWIREKYPDLPMISLDEIRLETGISPLDNQSKVVEIARERAKEYLRKKQSFVWNATNLSPMVRGKQLSLFERYHASVKIVYLETTWEEQLRRNANRPAAVPEAAVCRMLSEVVPPEVREAANVEWHCV